MSAHSPTRRPVPKVVAAALGGALTSIVLWALTAFTGVEVPAGVAAAVATVLSFAAGYLQPPGGALYDDADAQAQLGRALLGTLGVILLVIAAVLTVTTLLGVLIVSYAALILTALVGVVLLLVDGSTPA